MSVYFSVRGILKRFAEPIDAFRAAARESASCRRSVNVFVVFQGHDKTVLPSTVDIIAKFACGEMTWHSQKSQYAGMFKYPHDVRENPVSDYTGQILLAAAVAFSAWFVIKYKTYDVPKLVTLDAEDGFLGGIEEPGHNDVVDLRWREIDALAGPYGPVKYRHEPIVSVEYGDTAVVSHEQPPGETLCVKVADSAVLVIEVHGISRRLSERRATDAWRDASSSRLPAGKLVGGLCL